MITYNLMDTGTDSLYEHLCKCIKKDIIQGNLIPGEKLPSKRIFASNLGVSVITVENAYAQLVAEGYIYSVPKKGFYIADVGMLKTKDYAMIPEKAASLPLKEIAWFADFSSNQTSSDLFPFTIWSRGVRELLSDSRVELMKNSPCGGISELRENIARYLWDFRGMSVRSEQIIVGAGTEYLYGLLIQLLGNDKVYGVENPGYRKLEKIYGSYGVPCEWISMDEAGILVQELEEKNVDIIHITPSHQYPTGIVMPVSRRSELLQWAADKEERYIIEDDYDSELRLSGQPIPTLQGMDVSNHIIYMNTFTKTLCSTVRISYMILPEKLMTQFYRQLSFYSCTVSNFEQYTLSRFIEEGKFETHVNRLRNHYRKKRDLLMEALKRSRLKDRTTVSGEEAGLHFLMHIKTDLPEEQVIANAREKGIRLVPLSSYYYGTAKEKNVYVMNYSSIDIEKADEIMERICTSCE